MTSIEKKLKESEEIYRTLTEQSFLGISILQDDRIQYINNQLANTFGYTVEEIMAWKKGGFFNIIYPEDRKLVTEQARKKQLGESDSLDQYQFRGIKKNGDVLWLEVFSKSINYRGKTADFITIHDITNKKISDQKIKESEEKYRNLFNNAPFAIILLKIDGTILDCNVSSKLITGYSKEELIGKNFRDFNFYVDVKSANLEEREEKIKGGEIPETRDILLHNKDGSPFWARTTIEFVHLKDETYLQAIIQDVSEQKESQIKLEESETKFRTIFEAIPDLYFLVSGDTTILDYRGKEQEFYLSPDEFMGKKVVNLLPLHLSKSIEDQIRKTSMTQQSQSLEYELEINNEPHFFEARYFYLSKDKVSIFIRDITERKNIEKQISNLAKFPSENPNPVLRVNKDKIIYINKAGRDLLGLTEGSKIPKILEEAIVKALDENTIEILEVEFGNKNYIFNITPILQEGYANIYGGDITERKMSEIALNLEKQFSDDILNSSMDTVFVFNPESGRAIRWNNVFKEVSGYSDEEITSIKAPDSFYNDEDLKRASEATENVLEKGTFKVEMSLITKDGRSIPYEYTGTTLKNSSGDRLIVSVGRDISERKIAEEKIKDSEQKFRELYEDAPIAYFSVGTDKSILRVNKAAERVLGYKKDELLKMKVFDLYPDTELGLKRAKEIFTQFIAGESVKDKEVQMRHKEGNSIWISLSVDPIIDLEGNVIESRSMALDISNRKIAEEALKQSEQKYKEAYDRGNFYKDLFAHDINNILQVINSSAELIAYRLGESEKSKEIENISGIIRKQVSRGAKLISNVRTLSELEEKEIITRKVEIGNVLKNSITFVEKAYEERNINISYKSSGKEHFTNANELLQDVFENVLINAVKYNENSLIQITIKISRQKVEGNQFLKLEFLDNGIGVVDNRKEVIFMSGNRELKGSKGMGLGLSLVSKILQIFKGKIWVEDKIKGDYSKGSNFIIILPEI